MTKEKFAQVLTGFFASGFCPRFLENHEKVLLEGDIRQWVTTQWEDDKDTVKEICKECKDLPEGEVVRGCDHRAGEDVSALMQMHNRYMDELTKLSAEWSTQLANLYSKMVASGMDTKQAAKVDVSKLYEVIAALKAIGAPAFGASEPKDNMVHGHSDLGSSVHTHEHHGDVVLVDVQVHALCGDGVRKALNGTHLCGQFIFIEDHQRALEAVCLAEQQRIRLLVEEEKERCKGVTGRGLIACEHILEKI